MYLSTVLKTITIDIISYNKYLTTIQKQVAHFMLFVTQFAQINVNNSIFDLFN